MQLAALQICDMLYWTFWTYVSPSGRSDLQQEFDRYNDDDREAFSRAVAHLAVSPQSEWHDPHGKKLVGKEKLHEVKYKANRCATRAVGRFLPSTDKFAITVICTHKQKIYDPPEALKTAARRADQIEDGEAKIARLQIDGEDFPPDD